MRFSCLALCLLILSGCGSNSTADQNAESEGAQGIPLAIRNPEAVQDQSAEAIHSEEEQQAIQLLVSRAHEAISNGQAPQAIEALSQAIGIDPTASRLLRLRADVYAMSGELANARADFGMAVQADPQNAELRNMRGYFLMTNGLTDEAMEDFSKAIKLDPGRAAAWNNRGLIYLQRRNFESALREFESAVKSEGNYADGWNNLGFAKMKLGRLPEALSDIEQSLEINPEYVTAWNNRGLINMRMEDFEAAQQAFSKAIELAPLDARWYTHRIAALQKLERFEEAAKVQRRIEWVQRLTESTRHLNRDMGDAVRWIARGVILAEGEMYDEAIRNFSRALQMEPANVDALNARARVYSATDQLQLALDDCDQSIVIDSTQEALSIRGDVWLAMGNLDNAIADFEGAVRFDSSVATAYRDRAARHQQAGNQSLADEDLEAAKRIEDALSGRLVDESVAPESFPDVINVELSPPIQNAADGSSGQP